MILKIFQKIKIIVLRIKSNVFIHKLRLKGNIIGKRVFIGPNCRINGRNIKIFQNTTLVSNIVIDGEVEIGSNVIIAPNCTIISRNHDFSKTSECLPYGLKYSIKKVTIHDNVWIGMNVSICPGVTIAEGCIIGIGSVISKSTNKCEILAGNPARVIKSRDNERYDFLSQNKYYLNDIRGKRYIYFLKYLIILKIKKRLERVGKVYDYELHTNPIEVRHIMNEFYNKNCNQLKFINDEFGFFLELDKC